jgi:hypothetical protein
MADGNWQKVREIFDSALRRQPEERQKFVHEVCGVCPKTNAVAKLKHNIKKYQPFQVFHLLQKSICLIVTARFHKIQKHIIGDIGTIEI